MNTNKIIGAGLITTGIALLGNLVAVFTTPGVITGTSAQIINWTFIIEAIITTTSLMLIAITSLQARLEKIDHRVNALSERIGNFFSSIGAELLAITTGILISFIQEGLFPDRFGKIEKITTMIIVSVILGLSAHLISQKKMLIKIIGISLYISPILLFLFFSDTNFKEIIEIFTKSNSEQKLLLIGAAFSVALILILAIFRKRESFK